MGLNHVCTVLKAKSFLLGKTFGPWLDKALTVIQPGQEYSGG